MVREQDRLRMLQMSIAGQDDIEIGLGLAYERMTQRDVGMHQVGSTLLGVQTRIRCNLIVAAATRVQTRSRIPDIGRKSLFHRHMDILVVDIEREII